MEHTCEFCGLANHPWMATICSLGSDYYYRCQVVGDIDYFESPPRGLRRHSGAIDDYMWGDDYINDT